MRWQVSTFSAEDYVWSVNFAAKSIANALLEKGTVFQPEIALTLGSGLGDLAEQIEPILAIPYQDIHGFPTLSVQGHKGEMVIGHLCGVPIIGLSGRKHFYEVAQEPYGMMQVVFPVHVMASLGVKTYFATNAVGALNQNFAVGDLMVIEDHIDFFMPDPLMGPHLDFGNNFYFQPQHTEYDRELGRLFWQAAYNSYEKGNVHHGIYAARTGRTYETAATSRVLRQLGADAVGMSVIPEVIVATNRGMRTIAVSIVTNKIAEDGTNATSHEEVTAILESEAIKNRLTKTFRGFFEAYRRGQQRLGEMRKKYK
ncbi:purine-nucleoside phosphorylase [Candidatus Giovannonibacteria bacterium]|nr:purine-nucleoside phosphorylase [Candidatus Giovannonibacteria bacterium]